MLNARSILLALLYAGGLGWIALEAQRPSSLPAEEIGAAAAEIPEIQAPLPITTSIDVYDAIVERPLFVASRRPKQAAAVESTPQPATTRTDDTASIDGIRLSAVFKSSDTLTALVELSKGVSRSVYRGDQLGGWEVIEILDDRLTLGRRGERQTLKVHEFARITPQASAKTSREMPKRRPPSRRIRPTERTQPDGAQLPPTELVNSRKDPTR